MGILSRSNEKSKSKASTTIIRARVNTNKKLDNSSFQELIEEV